MSERVRFWVAVAGAALWIGYPFVSIAGGVAKWQVRCGGRSFSGGMDACFNDYIPVLELMAFPVTLLLLYPFLRFAFVLYAPPVEARGRRWWLARHGDGARYFPVVQMVAGAAMLWAVAHLASYPVAGRTAPFILYWVAWLAWLAVGIRASWPVAGHVE